MKGLCEGGNEPPGALKAISIEAFSEVRRNFHSHSWWDCRNFFTNRRLQFVQCMWLLTPSSGPKERSYRNLDNLSAIACLRADG
ncbi:hypothetical protein ANN_12389 [Periplaneta americana]|uniref:Uncharacterized protein n=1 Tax=Periplaneta americana TaxID=6978 RepID=A0ABQ8TGK3_PERAM|nr:hypothetical protein ANN_12389 [Periplaneta americana]